MVLSKAKTLTHHTSHAMRLINCRIIFKDQAVMVIELHTCKTRQRNKGLHNFFFQLAASVPVLLPLGAVSSRSTSWPSPCCPPHGFSPVSGTFCWPSLTHISSLGPHSLVTSSTKRQDTVCLLSAKYCHYMYVFGHHCQM